MAPNARRAARFADNDSLSTYLQDIRRFPILSRAEEADLADCISAGDRDALEQLVCSNLRFVVSIAKRYQRHGVALSDLISEGNLGLIRAAERFDGSKGVKFISYAVWWIRQAMIQTLADTGHAVSVPVNRAGRMYRIRRRAAALRQQLGRDPAQCELAADLAVSESDIELAMSVSSACLSLDTPLGEDANLFDYLPDTRKPDPDDQSLGATLTETVDGALKDLRDREAKVLRMYFGLDGGDEMSLESIGLQFGVTRERVRQIKENALSRLRRSNHAGTLGAFRDP